MAEQRLKNRVRIACLLLLSVMNSAHAVPDSIKSLVPGAQKVGEGRLTYVFWDVYDATLYAPQGQWRDNPPFALQLSYLRSLEGSKIADRAITEMREQGFDDEVRLATWHTQMRNIFPDVDQGVRLTGVYTQTGATIFYRNGAEIGSLSDPAFGQAFFGIWLDEKTSAPELRLQLIGIL